MEHVQVGMEVYSYNTRIGIVEGVAQAARGDSPALVVRRDGGLLQAAEAGTYEVSDGAVRIEESLLQDVIDAANPQRRSADELQTASAVQSRTGIAAGSRAAAELQGDEELRVPIMEEQVVVRRREVERGGVRVHKRVHEREELVEQPAFREEVDVQRVDIGKFVDVIPEPRQEGDTLVIPILEEVLVVEKRLVVKEEIRITRRRTEETQQVRVTLRQEEAIVERIEENEAGA